jgi:hypothetical protein
MEAHAVSDWIQKAKDFVKGHPEQAQQGLDKAEELINERTGGKYADKIDQGSDKLKDTLGLPPDADADGTIPPAVPEPPVPPAPAPTPAPTPEPGPGPVEPMPPVDPNDPAPVDPHLPGGPGPSEIPPADQG